jgi:hypothetical protein
MPTVNPEITVVVVAEKQSGAQTILFESPLCSVDSAGELWLEKDSGRTALFQPEDYYDEQLRNRRNSNNMVSPQGGSRLSLLGQVWGVVPYDRATHLELSRSKLKAQ